MVAIDERRTVSGAPPSSRGPAPAPVPVVVAVGGRPVHLEERYARMVRWLVALRGEMDGMRSGRVGFDFDGNSVGGGVEARSGPASGSAADRAGSTRPARQAPGVW